MGHFVCAGFWDIYRSVNLCTAATLLFDSRRVVALIRYPKMLKTVPDPPHNHHSLEDTLIQATEYALCALTVAQQAVRLQPRSHGSILMTASMHELESLRVLLESALIQVQMSAPPQARH